MIVSIIIPAYNEEKRIGKTLEEYGKFFKKLKKERKIKNFEILVVINNTKDRTPEIVDNYSKKYHEIKSLNFLQGGKGFATIEGFKEALKGNNELIGFVDADMASSPEAFYELIKNMGNFDGIIGSRYVKGAVVNPKQSIQRIIVSRIFNFLIRCLFFFPYKDTQCGIKLFKKEALKKIIPELIITKWAFDVDLLYCLKRNNFKIKEYPTVWGNKEYSKINFLKAGPLMALAIIRLRILNSPFRNFIKIYDKMPKWIKGKNFH
ncbi:glycosyltransferase [Candidatus Woesearchaeota archaeon]|nr:glycosyltransferase [Candidatus Woesearchaeota archaeon]